MCKEAGKCKEMAFVTEIMAEIERAVCVEYKKVWISFALDKRLNL